MNTTTNPNNHYHHQHTDPERQSIIIRITAARADPALADPFAQQPITLGTRDDYHALARFHYRPDPPATFDAILAIKHPNHNNNHTIAVLVISRPTLNAAWRDIAWPGRYTTNNKSHNAHKLNTELRTISRVIIDPRYRSLGLATRLIRHYLSNPLTPHTEAVAAMGIYCPFFERAGMTPCHPPQPPANIRLKDSLNHLNIQPGSLTTHISNNTNRITTSTASHSPTTRFIERELRTWARARPTHRPFASAPIKTLAARADAELLTHLAAYAHATHNTNQPAQPTARRQQGIGQDNRKTPTKQAPDEPLRTSRARKEAVKSFPMTQQTKANPEAANK